MSRAYHQLSLILETKRCTRCREVKSLAEYNKQRSGLTARCKACVNEASVEWRAAHPERVRLTNIEYRSRPENKEKARERDEKWLREHGERAKETKHRCYLAKRESRIAQAKEYALAHREENNAHLRKRYAANPERFRARNKQYRQGVGKESRIANAHRRRARVLGALGSFTPAEWQAIRIAQDHCCLMCGKREPEIILTRDHVIPLSRGGTNDASNLQGLCGPCNSRKHTRIIDLRRKEE